MSNQSTDVHPTHPPQSDPREARDPLREETCEITLSRTDRKLRYLLDLGRLINLDLELDDMLIQIARKATEVMEADRFTIFLYDKDRDELWTKVAVGVEGQEIRIPSRAGVAGYCFHTGETVTIADAYEDPRFYRFIDEATQYRTRTLLSMPLYSRSGQPLGVIQLINKRKGLFTVEDETFLRTFNNHAAVFIEMAQLQKARIEALERSRKELERLNRAKEKALDHLSHELKTPLALIQGSVRILRKKTAPAQGGLDRLFETLDRSVERLLETQQETDKIIRAYRATAGQAEKVSTEEEGRAGEGAEGVDLYEAVVSVVDQVRSRIGGRSLVIEMTGQKGCLVGVPGMVLKDVINGLLKNAVENTPDEGLIKIRVENMDGKGYLLDIQDFGVGIREENRGLIFEGLFHTRESDVYTSRRPYDFYAGGMGLDLLLVKLNGQRFGFETTVSSRRCIYLPTDRDLCPGRISLCRHCNGPETCHASGGSTFSVRFRAAGTGRGAATHP